LVFFADAASPRREAVAVVSSNVATGFGTSSFSASRAPLRRALRRGVLIPEFVFVTTCSGVRVVMAVMGAAVSEGMHVELNGGSAAVFISNHRGVASIGEIASWTWARRALGANSGDNPAKLFFGNLSLFAIQCAE
jgi:hypothetical protein